MPDFRIVKLFCADQHRISASEVAEALQDLRLNGDWHGVQIFPDSQLSPDGAWQFPRLGVGWNQGGDGYLVQCYENVYSNSHILSERPTFSEPEILMMLDLSGKTLWPRECFVAHQRALHAVLYFIETGCMEPTLDWVDLAAIPSRPS